MSRADEYATWIDCWARTVTASTHIVGMEHASIEERRPWAVRGRCREGVDAMIAAFPELRAVRGHYDHNPHWWCITPDGTIVDPTAAQFESGGTYVEYAGPDPYGKCMNCGDYVWTKEFSGACCKGCEQELYAYYNELTRDQTANR